MHLSYFSEVVCCEILDSNTCLFSLKMHFSLPQLFVSLVDVLSVAVCHQGQICKKADLCKSLSLCNKVLSLSLSLSVSPLPSHKHHTCVQRTQVRKSSKGDSKHFSSFPPRLLPCTDPPPLSVDSSLSLSLSLSQSLSNKVFEFEFSLSLSILVK